MEIECSRADPDAQRLGKGLINSFAKREEATGDASSPTVVLVRIAGPMARLAARTG